MADNEMNLFGLADASDFGDDPFHINPNTYFCKCVNIEMTEKEDGNRSLKLVWQINEPDSEYDGNKVTQYHTVIMKQKKDMTGKEVKQMKFYKMNLRNAFDLSEEQMNTLKPQDILGKGAYVTTFMNDKYVNVRTALCERLYKENNEVNSELEKSMMI